MKQKTFYTILIVCCLSLFSSAKQEANQCSPNTCCKMKKEKEVQTKESNRTEYNLAPMNLFMFGI